MPSTLLASACPAPQYRRTFLSISAAAAAANAPVSTPITTGSSLGFVGKLNSNGTRQDLTGSFGGGAYFVALGLALSPGTGLAVNAAVGTAMIDGPVNVEVAASLPVPASSARVWVWLSQSGILTYTTTTAPPAGDSCLLGSCVTSGTAVTSVDTSGVLTGLGTLQRMTADTGTPADTPAAGLHFMTVCPGGVFYWDGTAYHKMGS